MTPESLLYRKEIDGLRALAVVAVIANHFNNKLLPGGYLGVDIFFVISGYVIARSLNSRSPVRLREFLLTFYARRIKRIAPALIVFTVITGIAFSLFSANPRSALDLGVRSLFGVGNIALFRGSSDYFSSSSLLNPFTHTWSLGVEEQFYFVFPIIYWLSSEGQRRRPSYSWMLLILSAFSAASFVILYDNNQPAAYYLPTSRFWEIATGSLLLESETRNYPGLERLSRIPPLVPLIGLLLCLAVSSANREAIITILAVGLTALLIMTLNNNGAVKRILASPLGRYIGLRSYSAYLWHWGVLSISGLTIGIDMFTIPFQIAIIAALAHLSYKYVETPFRRARTSTGLTVTVGIGALFVSSLPLKVLGSEVPPFLYLGNRSLVNSLNDSRPMTGHFTSDKVSGSWSGKKCAFESNKDIAKQIEATGCTFGNYSFAKKRILVIGNSYSAAMVESFSEIAALDNDLAITITSAFGATPAPGISFKNPWSKASEIYWLDTVPRLVNDLRPGDAVFVVSNLDNFTGNPTTEEISNLSQKIISFSSELNKLELDLIYLRPIPNLGITNCTPAQATKEWFRRAEKNCNYQSKKEQINAAKEINSMFDKLRTYGIIKTVSLFKLFCPGDVCTHVGPNGIYLYRDEYGHPSNASARLAASEILNQLRPDGE